MPDSTNLPECISKRGVGVRGRNTDQFVSHVGVRDAICYGVRSESTKKLVNGKAHPFSHARACPGLEQHQKIDPRVL